jgi:DNA repair exonuclease SbcCD ATPase subunit
MAGSDDSEGRLDLTALRQELARFRADASRLHVQVEQLEQLRSRTTSELADLRTDLQKRNDAYRDLTRRHEELKALFVLATEQLDGIAERGTVQWQRPSESEARMRIIAAERSMHEVLIGFSDEVASIADSQGSIFLGPELRNRMAVILEQLESVHDELAIVTERLARHERKPGRVLLRLVLSRRFNRLRRVAKFR